MRIVGGAQKGRKLQAPAGRRLRPTSDRAREAMFNVVAHGLDGWATSESGGFEGKSIVDLFAGAGGLGLEGLSRGAAHATFVDVDKGHLAIIQKNAAELGRWRDITLLKLDATRLPPPARAVGAPCAVAFLDPPYGQGMASAALLGLTAKGWLAAGGLAIVEVAADEPLETPSALTLLDERTYGAARVVFLQNRA